MSDSTALQTGTAEQKPTPNKKRLWRRSAQFLVCHVTHASSSSSSHRSQQHRHEQCLRVCVCGHHSKGWWASSRSSRSRRSQTQSTFSAASSHRHATSSSPRFVCLLPPCLRHCLTSDAAATQQKYDLIELKHQLEEQRAHNVAKRAHYKRKIARERKAAALLQRRRQRLQQEHQELLAQLQAANADNLAAFCCASPAAAAPSVVAAPSMAAAATGMGTPLRLRSCSVNTSAALSQFVF